MNILERIYASIRISCISLFFILLFTVHLEAATYSIRQLTDNETFDRVPRLSDNGDVVWLGPDNVSSDDEVFLYNSATNNTIQLFENDREYESDPVINARGDIIWRRWDGFNYNLFLYDRTTSPPIITEIANYNSDVWNPHMNNNGDIVFSTRPGGSNDDLEVFLYVRATGVTYQITDNDTYDGAPKICGNGDIVWTHNDGDNEIILYSPLTDTTKILSNNNYDDHYVSDVNARGDVVWVATMPGSNYEIFLFDNASNSVTQFENTTCDESSPDINDNGDIVWSMSCPGIDREIILYNGSTKTAAPLTNNSWDDYLPKINNKRVVVWKGFSPGRSAYDLYVYDSSEKSTIKLTDNNFEEYIISINNSSQISWHAQVGSLGSDTVEIFLASPVNNPPPPPVSSGDIGPWLFLLLK